MAYRIRGEDVWERARDDYLAGDSALTVCDRYDLGLSALRKRARMDGWRRNDQPDPLIEFDDLGPRLDDYAVTDMVDEALQRCVDLARDGRVREAFRWLRLSRGLHETTEFRRKVLADGA